MAKISGLAALGAAPAGTDVFPLVDVSDTTQAASGTTKKVTMANVIDAVEANANTFTVAQTTKPASASVAGLTCDSQATPTAPQQDWRIDGILGARMELTDTATSLFLWERNVGNNQRGSYLAARRNSSAGAVGPAAGSLSVQAAAGGNYFVWVDAAGNLRLHTLPPTGSTGLPTTTDTAGTEVGSQTSWHALKENVTEWDGAEALDAIRSLTLYSYQMISDGQLTPDGDKPTYKGLVITDEDRASNAWFGLGYGEQQIPVLNDRNLYGYMLAAIRHGGNIINELQSQVAALIARVEALEGAE